MPIIGTLLKKGIKLRESLEQEYSSPFDLQKRELRKLLITARDTSFAQHYQFSKILKSFRSADPKAFYELYKGQVPIHDYNKIFNEWWHHTREGQKDIAWPGPVKYYALSSGTSEAASKYIPLTKDMLKAIRRTSIRQILTLSKYDLPDWLFEKGILMLGGSTELNRRENFFEGDLSGITAGQMPLWFHRFYKPGQKIAKNKVWNDKLDRITEKAAKWDIGIIVGVPAWVQLLIEKILDYYKVDNIHEIWPNLKIFVHGGVSFDPYRKGFEKLMGKPLVYIETYLASEGFLAFQAMPNRRSMRLVLNNGIFFEFVPFTPENFDSNGNIAENAPALMLHEVEDNKEYAVLISTCSGAWRYMIGDVIKFISKEEAEVVITGRTKHFLSLCGEHLSLDNMNKAIELASLELNLNIREFTVAGVPSGSLFAHHWYVGTDDPVEANVLRDRIDAHLKELNDDYRTERESALGEPLLEVLPTQRFYEWLKLLGKEGGQSKFPRVLKTSKLEDWTNFLASKKV